MSDLFGNTAKRFNNCLGCGNPILPGHICNPIAKARKTDPETSHEAARKVERNGNAKAQRNQCLAVLRIDPGQTAAELQATLKFLAHKRLPELRQAGLVYNGSERRCRATGNMAMTWYCMDTPPLVPPFIDLLGAGAD